MTKPTISTTQTHFIADIKGSGWGVVFSFSKAELAQGASLSRMMTFAVRDTLKNSGWAVPKDDLKRAAAAALPYIRAEVESYFAAPQNTP